MRVLADGHIKFALLTTKPLEPAQPKTTELTAGIDMSCKVLRENFQFGAADSDKIGEAALCDTANSNALGPSNFQVGFTVWRMFEDDGDDFDAEEDAGFEAVKIKGATVWLYGRQTKKLATDPWAAGDEIFFGCEAVNDEPQRADTGGFIKYRVPMEVQRSYPWITAAAGN